MGAFFDWLNEMLVATAMGLAIGAVYWRLHRGFTYSFTFVQTCVLTVILCTVISRIVSNASSSSMAIAFALVGMLGLIRFRTVVRDTRELTFLFLAITAGIAIGSGSTVSGVGGCIVALVVLYVLAKAGFGVTDTSAFRIKVKSSSDETDYIVAQLTDITESLDLISTKVDEEGIFACSFDVVTNLKQTPSFLMQRLTGGTKKIDVSVTRQGRNRSINDKDDD
ncbi:DUF4956 domain-containing protein [Rhizobium sp. BK418]|uniref:DUF4956 domain-containing protein n=1 Tax=Rhizobium sp. BK418 TaxID=2512120 RepID=UPI0010513BC8|nr:DUF4956 domain-containing protein [Rhizobium sp. BK418]TCR98809.1 putative membrane protein YhiD involved in acid resistance [Rhizobium sp. BK418]